MSNSSLLSADNLMITNKIDDKTVLFEKDGIVHLLMDLEEKTLFIVSDQYPEMFAANGKNITQDMFDITLCNAMEEFKLSQDCLCIDLKNSHEEVHPQMVQSLEKALDRSFLYHNMTSDHVLSIGHATPSTARKTVGFKKMDVDPDYMTRNFTSDHILSI